MHNGTPGYQFEEFDYIYNYKCNPNKRKRELKKRIVIKQVCI